MSSILDITERVRRIVRDPHITTADMVAVYLSDRDLPDLTNLSEGYRESLVQSAVRTYQMLQAVPVDSNGP